MIMRHELFLSIGFITEHTHTLANNLSVYVSVEAQSVERATPGEEVLGSIPTVAAHSLLVGSVSV